MHRFQTPLFLKCTAALLIWTSFGACVSKPKARPPPSNALYFPTGIVYVDDPASSSGYLYVASSNFDRRFDSGSVTAIHLSSVTDAQGNPLPPIGAPLPGSQAPTFQNFGSGLGQVFIQTFAGEMAEYLTNSGKVRLFVPSRGDQNPIQAIDAQGTSLTCAQGPSSNCADFAPSLTAFQSTPSGKPAAPEPLGVGIWQGSGPADPGQVFVTHLKDTDSPYGSGRNLESYVVYLDAEQPTSDNLNFVSLGLVDNGDGQTTNSVVVGRRYAYATSRYRGTNGAMIVFIDRQQLGSGSAAQFPGLESSFYTLEARGIAVNAAETRLYVAAQSPDSLVVVDIADATADSPGFRIASAVSMPPGPNEVRVLSRKGLSPLVLVTSSTAGALSIYDDGLDRVVAQLSGIGVEPFGLAVQTSGDSARAFITDFGDGRITVVDIPSLQRPEEARIAAYLGMAQVCPSTTLEIPCLGNLP